jgi:uncharacterized protein (UPF0332 family)
MDSTIALLLKRAEENIRGARVLLKEKLAGPAASRTYYAMFYIAQVLLFSLGLSFSKHSAVISRFGQEFAKTKKLDPVFHQYLIDGFEARQLADYGITEDMGHEQVSRMIENAEAFLKAAKSYLKKTH